MDRVFQFGMRRPGVLYSDRPCVYGLLLDEQGRIAVAEIGFGPHYEYDLPGGGLDGRETESAALEREFLEEVGVPVRAERVVVRANQYWNKADVRPRNSQCAFWMVEATGPERNPVEPDHSLRWMDPWSAIKAMRHDAHAFAIQHFIRSMS